MRAKVRANVLSRRLIVVVEVIVHRDGERIGVDGGFRFRRHAVRSERGLELLLVTTDEIGWLGPGEEREQQ